MTTSLTTSLQGTPIDGAVALVTGGHRGFGRALVDELLGRGATKIYATSRSPQPSRDERIVPIVLDVTDEASVTAAAQAAHDVSIVVNNAGIALGTPVLEAPIDRIREELEINLFGTIRVTRAFAPVLATQPRIWSEPSASCACGRSRRGSCRRGMPGSPRRQGRTRSCTGQRGRRRPLERGVRLP
jgi:NAD(P)-dependent dehydrogenase (short-subunit alcohol dehydrogenase family)